MESAADKLSILQESVNAFFIRFFDGMYPDREDRDPDLVKLKRIGSLNQFNGVDKDCNGCATNSLDAQRSPMGFDDFLMVAIDLPKDINGFP